MRSARNTRVCIGPCCIDINALKAVERRDVAKSRTKRTDPLATDSDNDTNDTNDTNSTNDTNNTIDIVVPENCEGEWQDWSACAPTGMHRRTYRVTKPPVAHGKLCDPGGVDRRRRRATLPKISDGTAEQEGECPFDCVGNWTDWSTCTDDGKRHREYTVQEVSNRRRRGGGKVRAFKSIQAAPIQRHTTQALLLETVRVSLYRCGLYRYKRP